MGIATTFNENIHRLVLGIKPIDPIINRGLLHHIHVELEKQSPHKTINSKDIYCAPQIKGRAPDMFCRHHSGRFSLIYYPGIKEEITVRLYDSHRHFIPRRLLIPLVALEDVLDGEESEESDYLQGRVREPVLFPAAAYDICSRSTGLRGSVTRNDKPMRWAVIEARLTTNDALVGRARSDDRGEFLLLIAADASPEGELDSTGLLVVNITVFGPATIPVPSDPLLPQQDWLWDLPIENIPSPGVADNVSNGETLPPEYVISSSATREVTLQIGRILTGVNEGAFVFALP